MNTELLLGDEAIALGAIDAGISGVYAYPGTPSTEIAEYIQAYQKENGENIQTSWSVNEKTAYEEALGMSYAGRRALVCMKHVGLNVAADAFINSAITGVNGGLVIVVADDPSMHSSQNEQDSRYYAKFAMVPLIEPSNQQEAYDGVRYAFDLSESLKLPVMLRITTRLAHSRSIIKRDLPRPQNPLHPEKNLRKFVLLPSNARLNYSYLVDKQAKIVEISENSFFNKIHEGSNPSKAIIAFGIGYNYVMEVLQKNNLDISVFKMGFYPLPSKKLKHFCEKYESILVVEEGYPVYEELLKGFFGDGKFSGRLDGVLPRTGELNPDHIMNALSIKSKVYYEVPELVKPRLPQLCQGCSHRDLFENLKVVLANYPNYRVFSDIGCYTLGALPPFEVIHSCVDMGASITMAKGAADAGFRPAIAVIGDSTFTHSGITGLLDAVNDNSPLTVIISDNRTTAMTGGQTSAGTDRLVSICKGIGVEENHIRKIEPLKKNEEQNIAAISEEIAYNGVSVIIAERECIQTAIRRKRQQV